MANFPTSVSTNANLYIAVNGLQTTLAVSILSTDTTIQLASTTGFPTTGLVTIDNVEVVSYTGITGPNLTGCTRGADGTTALAHNAGVTVGATIVAAHHNLSKDEIIAIETALGAGFAKGNLTAGSTKITVTGGTGAVIGSGSTVDIGVFNLGQLSNVVLTSPATNDLLTFNGTNWVNITAPTLSGDLTFLNQKGIILKELTANGTDSTKIEAADDVTTSYTLKLPPALGAAGSVPTDVAGNGVLTMVVPSGSGTVNPGTAGQLAYYATSTTAVSPFTGASIAQLLSYRRPNLVYRSGTVVDLETGLDGTSGDVTILFPDGVFRTDSDATRVRMTISQNAVFNNGTRASNIGGLDTGTVANNTWYAVYAVKVTAGSGSTTDFVAVASLTLPLQANYSTLNSNFGTNGWVYIGLIRYGDESGVPGAILKFTQSGHQTIFRNACASNEGGPARGLNVASAVSASSLTYTYAAGTSGTNIPANIGLAYWTCRTGAASSGNSIQVKNSASTLFYDTLVGAGSSGLMTNVQAAVSEGILLNGNTFTGTLDLYLAGFVDSALGIGLNPLL